SAASPFSRTSAIISATAPATSAPFTLRAKSSLSLTSPRFIILIMSVRLPGRHGHVRREGAYLFVLEFIPRLVGDEPRGNGQEARYQTKVVMIQDRRGLHDGHEHVREHEDGRQLDGAVELDDVDGPPALRVLAARDAGELGGHAQRGAHRRAPALRTRHAHGAAADAPDQPRISGPPRRPPPRSAG